ncbi:ATP synthase subunit b, mitochondrial-like [Limulus polyphemus]|uniref:ATP synthase subunit b n=1 Tax=Limulus polyphemus TaxID=6850 RepID=A0ABM1BC03_LIMPO|nr:ATP synthase subunit b, mitochondrial-like [Limulus polyphemus]
MLSRLALRGNHLQHAIPTLSVSQFRLSSSSQPTSPKGQQPATVTAEERDLVNFPRPLRPMYSGKVRLGFIPEEWFQFFYKKTGVTGPYLFGSGLITYLCSKEIFILEHEFYTGLCIAIMVIFAAKKFGPGVSKYLDKEIAEYEGMWNDYKDSSVKSIEDAIAEEKKEQWRLEGQKMLFDAKRENVQLQLESEYRHRLMQVYEEVKKRMDYQVQLVNTRRMLEQKHMVNWIVDSVIKGISPQQEKEALQKCMSDLKSLAASVH